MSFPRDWKILPTILAALLLGARMAGAEASPEPWPPGARVIVEKAGSGHRAIVLRSEPGRSFVAYEGEDDTFDEWVEVALIRTVPSRTARPVALKPREETPPESDPAAVAPAAPPVDFTALADGQALPRPAADAATAVAWLEPLPRASAAEPQRFNEAKLAQPVFDQPAAGGGIASGGIPRRMVLLPARAGVTTGFAAIERGEVVIYRPDAAGRWARRGTLDTAVFGPHELTQLQAGDLNNDGETDLVVAGGPVLQVYFGTADGRQEPSARAYRGRLPLHGVATGKFFVGANPMGIAVVEGENTIRLIAATRAGLAPANEPFAVKFDRILDLVAGDFDGDGFADLAITTETKGRSTGAWMFFNQNSASQAFLWPVGGKDDFARALAVADLDRDGRDDLIMTDNDADRGEHVRVVFGSAGRSGWEDPWDLISSEFGVGLGTASVVVADFNRDGRRDIGVAGRNGLRLHLGADYRRFSRNPVWPVMRRGGTLPEHRAFLAADFDGDGAADLLGCTPAFATGFNLVRNATPAKTLEVFVPPPLRKKTPAQASSTVAKVQAVGDAPPGTPVLQFLASRAEPYGPYRYRIVVEVAVLGDGVVSAVEGVCKYDNGGPLQEVAGIATRKGDQQWSVEVVLPRGHNYSFTLTARDDKGQTAQPLHVMVNP